MLRKRLRSRFLSFTLTLSIGLQLLPVAALAAEPVSTTDVPTYADTRGHWAGASIERWSGYGVVEGSEGRFRPDESITRAELAAVIDRMLRYERLSNETFSDLPANAWYADNMRHVAASGVMQGASGKAFPNDNVTREETAVMLGRAFQITGASANPSQFSDNGQIADWAAPIVKRMSEKGYITGRPDGKFDPKASVTRAEVVKMLDTMIQGYYNKPGEYTAPNNALNGNVLINTRGVKINGMSIDGNLYLAPGIGKDDVALENVHVADTAYVWGGGSLNLKGNSDFSAVVAENSLIRLDKEARIGELQVKAPLAVEGEGKINKVFVAREGSGAAFGSWPGEVVLGAGADLVVKGEKYTNSRSSDVVVSPTTPSNSANSSGTSSSGSSSSSYILRSGNSSLSGLTVGADVGKALLSPAFAAGTVEYTATVSTIAAKVTVNVPAADAGATVAITVSGTGASLTGSEVTLATSGDTVITVKVTAANGTVTEYKTTVSKALSHDSSLSGLSFTADAGPAALVPAFVSGTYTYAAAVSTAASKVTVSAAAAGAGAAVEITASGTGASVAGSEVTLATAGDTVITVKVTAADGTVTEYKTTVSKTLGHDSSLSALSLTADVGTATLSPAFAAGTYAYTASVSTAASTITVNAAATGAGIGATVVVTVSGTGASAAGNVVTLASSGATTITVTVTAVDGTVTEYTTTVSKTLSHDSSLSVLSLTPDTGTAAFAPVFASGTYAYTASVATAVYTVTVNATAAGAGAAVTVTVAGIGASASGSTVTLAANGVTTITVKVTAEDGTFTEYTVAVAKKDIISFAGTSSLSTLIGGLPGAYTVLGSGGSENVALVYPGVGPHDYSANSAVLAIAKEVTQKSTLTKLSADFTNNMVLALVGTMLTVKADLYVDDNNDGVYEKQAGLQLLPAYTGILTLGTRTEASDDTLNISLEAGSKVLVVFHMEAAGLSLINTVSGNVAAELTLVPSNSPSGNSKLNSLSLTANVGPAALSPAFAAGTLAYATNVSEAASRMNVNAIAAAAGAGATVAVTASGTGASASGNTVTLASSGATTITVTVTAADSTVTSYTITVNKNLNHNSSLSGLSLTPNVGTAALSPVFAAGTLAYTSAVSTAAATVTVNATAAGAGATVDVTASGTGASASGNTVTLASSGTTTVTVTVTAADGATTSYTVTVDKSLSHDSSLSALSLTPNTGSATLDPTFVAGTHAYTASVTSAVYMVTVNATAAGTGATVSVTASGTGASATGNAVTLATSGATTITVTVTSADGSTTAYTVTVSKSTTFSFTGTSTVTTLLGGLAGPYSVLGTSGGENISTVYQSSSMDLSTNSTALAHAQVVSQGSTLKKFSAKFKNNLAMTLVGSALTVYAEVFADDNNDGVFEPKASLTLTPDYTGVVAIEEQVAENQDNLNVSITAGSKLLVVFHMTASGLMLVNAVPGTVEATLVLE
ncbi:cadherin-like beta sandwich domain-containing protein [Paenibacillus thalictri]|uniref:SLH domain-containing protein n=1 Tax=Paenibacillus thalictri TaxID=2527873 RepID=A0A4Q9DVF8_9BACL|nr:cadherin-like beta sandwich domain-containing protein [Paenibacillus thalictri]TBL81024.1 hypothetical protein EYB31_02705 [Paenibacillus thalictri]